MGKERIWVFGLVERSPVEPGMEDESKCYMEIVEDREAVTLLDIIYKKCITIFSDCWSYNKIKYFKNQPQC